MKEALVQRALELGFDACRVTHAGAPEQAPRFLAWLDAGCHGGMGYLERTREKRIEPGLVLEGARSIVLLAVAYCSGGGGRASGGSGMAGPTGPTGTLGPTGVVARYARGEDYHEVMGPRLALLTSFLNELAGPATRSRWYVDTGPVLERELAQRAGLGFVGKHTNLIGRDLGNWFLLAAILTTALLAPDEPEANRCGKCERCLAACPTQAITAPFRLDARRCISYLTIELKGSIPEEYRPLLGRRIFGCDDCLEVCPWNRFAREGRMLADTRRNDLEQPELLALLGLDEAGFRRQFRGTPLWRAKRRGLLRNVCVALGNSGDARALEALGRAAIDPEPLIAEHALWAIRRIRERLAGGGATA